MVLTSVTDENEKTFDNLMPETISARLSREDGWFALGVICPGEGAEYAAGVLVFSVEEGSNGEEDLTAAVIQWLYVAKQFRRGGAGEALLRELFRILEASGVAHILCDLPMPEEYNELCAYLESWGFVVGLAEVYEATVPLRDIAGHPLIKGGQVEGKIFPLSKIPEFYVKNYVAKARQFPGVLSTLSPDAGSYDQDVSCAYLEGNAVEGALLVRSGRGEGLEVMLMRASSGAAVMGMLHFSAGAAAGKYSLDTPVRLVCRLAETASIVARLFPRLEPLLVRRAYYGMYETEDDSGRNEGNHHG